MQDGSFRRVGGTRDLKVTARVISATNQDLKKLIADGKFRADLYYRLCVIPIHVPPLRERTEDIPILADHFLQELNIKYGLRKQFSQGLVDWMLSYSWPGNVRELKNLVERLFVSSSKISSSFPIWVLKIWMKLSPIPVIKRTLPLKRQWQTWKNCSSPGL